MKLLSLRLCGHDSNISYFDGTTVRYYRSERDFQIKHHAFNNLWEWRDVVKRIWNLDYREIDQIAVILEPRNYNLPGFKEDIFPYIEYDLFPIGQNCKVYRLDHHYAHSLSSWMLIDRQPDINIVIDGCGDAESETPWSVIKNDVLIARGKLSDCDSLGRLMVELGDFLGIPRSNAVSPIDGLDTAGKVMALQSYGTINYEFLKTLEQYDWYSLNKIYNFNNFIDFIQDERLACHSGLDWARTIHHKSELVLLDFFKKYVRESDLITYTGGVAQNIIWNTALKNSFKDLIIPPHCADDGLSLGGIEFLRIKNNLPKFKIENFPYIQSDDLTSEVSDITIAETAQLLASGKVVAWYQGNGEVGPRALGNRSILLDPRIPNGKEIVNRIKKRENYRPFGASMLEEHSKDLFEINFSDPFMLYTYKVKDKTLKSITHIDKTCRLQSVTNSNLVFRKLLEKFYELTGCPVLLNTSLNVNGRPIAAHHSDAFELFENSAIDCLVIGNKMFKK